MLRAPRGQPDELVFLKCRDRMNGILMLDYTPVARLPLRDVSVRSDGKEADNLIAGQ